MKNFSRDTAEAFDRLPKYLQENIIQSGVEIGSPQQLDNIVRKFYVGDPAGQPSSVGDPSETKTGT